MEMEAFKAWLNENPVALGALVPIVVFCFFSVNEVVKKVKKAKSQDTKKP